MVERLKLKQSCYLTLSALTVLCVSCQQSTLPPVNREHVHAATGPRADYEQAVDEEIARGVATNTFSTYPEVQAYDCDLYTAISRRWYDLIDLRSLNTHQIGRVDVRFDLHADGTVTDVVMATYTMPDVYGILCVKAVADLAPYPKWSEQVRSRIGKDDYLFSISFNYEGPSEARQGLTKEPH